MEEKIKTELHQYLLYCGMLDERLPECPDVENKWEETAKAYLPDGVREYNGYPTVSLGWMMFLGMAIAKFWDEDWEKYSAKENLYESLRDARGFDCMDDYITEEVLSLTGDEATANGKLVSQCANRVYNILRHEPLEPGTQEAFHAYMDCLHQMYLTGMAVQLKRMGYSMQKVN